MHKPTLPNLSLLGLLFLAQDASATVSMYQAAVQADADAIHQWSFEGATTMSRQNDSVGTNTLVPTTGSSGSTAAITFAGGFDSTGSAFTPQRVAGNNGAAYLTSSNIAMPSAVSFEAIIQPGILSTDTAVYGYVMGTRAATATRNYFLMQKGGAADNRDLINISGDNFGNNQDTIVDNYTSGDWYYIAITLEISGANTIVNAWSSNLTTGSALSQTVTNETETGTFVNDYKYGIGMLNSIGAYSDFYAGAIDEIALYNTAKKQPFFEANRALIVPEPSSLLLGLIGCGALFTRRRRQ